MEDAGGEQTKFEVDLGGDAGGVGFLVEGVFMVQGVELGDWPLHLYIIDRWGGVGYGGIGRGIWGGKGNGRMGVRMIEYDGNKNSKCAYFFYKHEF